MSIQLINLTKGYDGLAIVAGVNLEIQDGELFVLLGGSGSGKSTILRMIAGLAAPDSGRILLHGRDVTRLSPQARNTGFVFQNYSIFKHMTVAQNIEFGLRIRKVPPTERRVRSEELMDLVGLSGYGQRYPDQLSGGQQQRVALARALAYEPSVLLLDEPFGALDVKIRGQLRRNLREIQQQLKVTAILVTHDQEEGFELADRIGVLERGNLIEVGSPEQLYHRPASQFVATFIGGGNLMVGRIEGDCVRLGARKLQLPEGAPAHLEGAPARVLIRPENLQLVPESEADGPDSLGVAEIRECVFAGPQQRLRVRMDELQGVRTVAPAPAYGQTAPLLEALQPSSAEGLDWRPGQRVAVRVRSLHVLERTGLRSLVVIENSQAGEVVGQFAKRMLTTTGAPGTLLGLLTADESERELTRKLEALRAQVAGTTKVEVKLRRGTALTEVTAEARQGMHELILLGEEPGPTRTRLRPFTCSLLKKTDVPVLVVHMDRAAIQRVVICTGGGEPGKGDVWMGGRMAKRLGAQASVIHVCRGSAEDKSKERALRHLDRALDSLRGIGVNATRELLEGDEVAETVRRYALDSKADLLVLGIPESWDMTTRLVRSLEIPVLFVPLASG